MEMLYKLLKDEKGSAVVELAITLPLILVLVFGYIFFMNGLETQMVMQIAAREGARVYANPIRYANMKELAISKTQEELNRNKIDNATIKAYASGYKRYVIIEKPYFTYFPKKTFTLKAGAVFHIEPYDQ